MGPSGGRSEGGAENQSGNYAEEEQVNTAKAQHCGAAQAAEDDAHWMDEACLQASQRLGFGSVPPKESLAEDAERRRIEIEARVTAEDDTSGCGITRIYTVNAEAFGVFCEDHITALQVQGPRRRNHDFIPIQKVRAHALSVHLELHGIAPPKQRITEFGKQPGVLADLRIRRAHSEPPPLRLA